MGLVVKISAYGEWSCTYLVQTLDKTEAKERAFKVFKQSASCYMPDTLEEAENDDGISIEIVVEVEYILF